MESFKAKTKVEQEVGLEGIDREKITNAATLSAGAVAAFLTLAQAEGASADTVYDCISTQTRSNIVLVQNNFSQLNTEIERVVDAQREALHDRDFQNAQELNTEAGELGDVRAENIAWVAQMKLYCEQQLNNLALEIERTKHEGTSVDELEKKKEELQAVLIDIEDLRLGWRDF